MSAFSTPTRVIAGALVVATGAGAIATAVNAHSSAPSAVQVAAPAPAATTAQAPAPVPAQAPAPAPAHAGRVPTKAQANRINHLTTVARHQWAAEAGGSVTHATLRRVAADPVLRRDLQSGNLAALRAYVRTQFSGVWYHWHVSRMRILKGSKVVVDAGVPFVVAPSQMTLRSSNGRTLGTLQVSIQDVIGFVRLMHRHHPVDVVARGVGSGHVRTSLPAAAQAKLPASGFVTIAGKRYLTRSFSAKALAGEPVQVWILTRA